MNEDIIVVEHCAETGMYIGYISGIPGAHSQAETVDELRANLVEVVEMLAEEDGVLNPVERNL